MDELSHQTRAALELSLCEGVSSGTIFSLVEHFGSAAAALEASPEALQAVRGVGPATAGAIRRGPDAGAVEKEMDLMKRHRVGLVPFFSPDYPAPLKHLDRAAPALLRVKGDYRRVDQLAVAIVGARRCTGYGRRRAGRLAADLASMGFTVVSGMAWGVDSAAHRGALVAGGRTLAVLGCGLAHELSPDDRRLAEEIVGSGALISELSMETPPRGQNFPPRNRIISGLSLGVVVAEAARRSGSLITAGHAADQGKPVFAVPGDVTSPVSRGCHALIRDGAILVENARDVVEGLGPLSEPIELPRPEQGPMPETVDDARVMVLNEREKQIYEMLSTRPLQIDDVIQQTGLPASIVSSTLLTLEIRGLIQQLSGQRYVRG